MQRLRAALRDGAAVPLGTPLPAKLTVESAVGKVILDDAGLGRTFGQLLSGPGVGGAGATVARGARVSAAFAGAHPNNSVARRTSLMRVERQVAGG